MVSRSKKPAKNKTNKPKKKPIPRNIRTRCLTSFQKLRRMEEANDEGYVQCISCGKIFSWKEVHGGHYIPRTVRTTELDPDNVWPQCNKCNTYLAGNIFGYRQNLLKKIGKERVERLENLRAAYYGDEDAYENLHPSDREIVNSKKNLGYYAARYEEISARLKEEEKRHGAG